jgi:hypothetical protein
MSAVSFYKTNGYGTVLFGPPGLRPHFLKWRFLEAPESGGILGLSGP